jgi:predicted enzyme related to lactoylglutathione lyase
MPSRLYTVVVDSKDPRRLAEFWAAVLDYQVVYEEPGSEVVVARDEQTYPGLIFVPVPEDKVVKNRLHLDLNPDDRGRELERLEKLGATKADVGRGPDVTWVVMRDPEGNEFCVLRPREGGV